MKKKQMSWSRLLFYSIIFVCGSLDAVLTSKRSKLDCFSANRIVFKLFGSGLDICNHSENLLWGRGIGCRRDKVGTHWSVPNTMKRSNTRILLVFFVVRKIHFGGGCDSVTEGVIKVHLTLFVQIDWWRGYITPCILIQIAEWILNRIARLLLVVVRAIIIVIVIVILVIVIVIIVDLDA